MPVQESFSRKIIATADGSHSLWVEGLDESYHSVHGAIQESRHIFIQNGIQRYGVRELKILEAGFGTGLNAYLALVDAFEHERIIEYHTYEKYPLKPEEYETLNYATHISFEQPELFRKLHSCPWNELNRITSCFSICKYSTGFEGVEQKPCFDIVFYDAFSPEVQPHLWTEELLGRFTRALKPGGILVTYCVKGVVKQALRRLGLTVKRLPGPPGKREMLLAEYGL